MVNTVNSERKRVFFVSGVQERARGGTDREETERCPASPQPPREGILVLTAAGPKHRVMGYYRSPTTTHFRFSEVVQIPMIPPHIPIHMLLLTIQK